MYYWGHPQFFGVRAAAANIGGSPGDYTAEQFQQDYPQFFNAEGQPLVPAAMLSELINMAALAVVCLAAYFYFTYTLAKLLLAQRARQESPCTVPVKG